MSPVCVQRKGREMRENSCQYHRHRFEPSRKEKGQEEKGVKEKAETDFGWRWSSPIALSGVEVGDAVRACTERGEHVGDVAVAPPLRRLGTYPAACGRASAPVTRLKQARSP